MENIFNQFTHQTFYQMQNYSQFTIDKMEEFEEGLDDILEGESELSLEDYLKATSYEVQNIIDVLKDGKDKNLFIELSVKL